jgi:hypothetical protein
MEFEHVFIEFPAQPGLQAESVSTLKKIMTMKKQAVLKSIVFGGVLALAAGLVNCNKNNTEPENSTTSNTSGAGTSTTSSTKITGGTTGSSTESSTGSSTGTTGETSSTTTGNTSTTGSDPVGTT